MRNLGDLNDLYNAQDVVLLCEITENRFFKQWMILMDLIQENVILQDQWVVILKGRCLE